MSDELRRTGRSTRYINWFLDDPDNRVIVTAHERMAENLAGQALDKGYDAGSLKHVRRHFMGADRALRDLRGRKCDVHVDEFEQIPERVYNDLWDIMQACKIN